MTINLNLKKRSCNTTSTLFKVGGLLFLALQTWLVLSWKRVTGTLQLRELEIEGPLSNLSNSTGRLSIYRGL